MIRVTADTDRLGKTLGALVNAALGELGAALVDIADDAEVNAEGKWYTQVRRRTGRTGQLSTELRTRGERLNAVVLAPDKVSYMIKRPGPLSMVNRLLTGSEYAEAMRQFRKTGKVAADVKVQKYDKNGRPVGMYLERRNPLASDGKNVWRELVLREGADIVEARAADLDAALQRAADRIVKR